MLAGLATERHREAAKRNSFGAAPGFPEMAVAGGREQHPAPEPGAGRWPSRIRRMPPAALQNNEPAGAALPAAARHSRLQQANPPNRRVASRSSEWHASTGPPAPEAVAARAAPDSR